MPNVENKTWMAGTSPAMTLYDCHRSLRPPPMPPNILFIMADQLRWDYLGCAGIRI